MEDEAFAGAFLFVPGFYSDLLERSMRVGMNLKIEEPCTSALEMRKPRDPKAAGFSSPGIIPLEKRMGLIANPL
jgi:hypothetical protein